MVGRMSPNSNKVDTALHHLVAAEVAEGEHQAQPMEHLVKVVEVDSVKVEDEVASEKREENQGSLRLVKGRNQNLTVNEKMEVKAHSEVEKEAQEEVTLEAEAVAVEEAIQEVGVILEVEVALGDDHTAVDEETILTVVGALDLEEVAEVALKDDRIHNSAERRLLPKVIRENPLKKEAAKREASEQKGLKGDFINNIELYH
jgi:hypothetical protein